MDENQKRMEEIENRCQSCHTCEGNGRIWADGKAHYPSYHGPTVACGDCGGTGRQGPTVDDIDWLLSIIKSLQKDNRELKEQPNIVSICNACDLNRKALADSQEQFFQVTRELASLRSLIRTQETEPPFDVAEDQTTEMAVRIAYLKDELYEFQKEAVAVAARNMELNAQLQAANERGERIREALTKAVAAAHIRRDLGKKIYNQEIKASWLPEAEQALTDQNEFFCG